MPSTALGWLDFLVPKDLSSRRIARNVRFGPDPRHVLDLYAPRRPRGRLPLLVFVHGGGWDSGDRCEYSFAGRALAALGFLVACADYRVFPDAVFPAFVEDLATAANWLVAHAKEHGGDPGRLVLAGHSAGAYNAVMLGLDGRYLRAAGVDPRKVKAVAGLSGPYDFLPLDGPITRRTFGETSDLTATQPTAHVTRESPPAFLATGDADTVVYPRNTTALARKLRDAGVPVEERHYAGVDHVRMILALSRPLRGRAPVLDEMTGFLQRHAR